MEFTVIHYATRCREGLAKNQLETSLNFSFGGKHQLGVVGGEKQRHQVAINKMKTDHRVAFSGFASGQSTVLEMVSKYSHVELQACNYRHHAHRCLGILGDKLPYRKVATQEVEGFLLDAINLNFFERLNLAWRILFPSATAQRNSNARIAKQRLKMILFSDRCEVSDEAKRKIVSNIVGALSDFVEIDSQDKVQLSVSADPDLGTVYSVTVPVRRVKPEYQDDGEDYRGITSIKYKDTGEESGTVDVRFDFFVPNDRIQ